LRKIIRYSHALPTPVDLIGALKQARNSAPGAYYFVYKGTIQANEYMVIAIFNCIEIYKCMLLKTIELRGWSSHGLYGENASHNRQIHRHPIKQRLFTY
jgi:hypothetical protein